MSGVVWLYLAIEIRWVGERLPKRPQLGTPGWWLCWVGADVIANRRFDEHRTQLLKIPCSSERDAEIELQRMQSQVTIPSGSVTIRRIDAEDFGTRLWLKKLACKELNEQFDAPAYTGDCAGRRVKR